MFCNSSLKLNMANCRHFEKWNVLWLVTFKRWFAQCLLFPAILIPRQETLLNVFHGDIRLGAGDDQHFRIQLRPFPSLCSDLKITWPYEMKSWYILNHNIDSMLVKRGGRSLDQSKFLATNFATQSYWQMKRSLGSRIRGRDLYRVTKLQRLQMAL